MVLPLASGTGWGGAGESAGGRREWDDFPQWASPGPPCDQLSRPLHGRMLIPPDQGWDKRGFVGIICTCISALAIGQTIKDTIFTQLTRGSNIRSLILCPLDFYGLNLNGF